MHNYHDSHGRLPPAVVYGASGEPLYSWRVLILPYLEQQELYNEFHLDEPWDSPHNFPLVQRMPKIYAAPGRKVSQAPPGHTFIHVFTGEGTAFENREGETFASFTDGTCDTILLVEGGEAVPWSKPGDIAYAADQPLPPLATVFKDGFRVAFAAGPPRFVKKQTSEALLRAAITRNGGEKIPLDWDRCPDE